MLADATAAFHLGRKAHTAPQWTCKLEGREEQAEADRDDFAQQQQDQKEALAACGTQSELYPGEKESTVKPSQEAAASFMLCRLLSRPASRLQQSCQPPVLVLPNGQFEIRARISDVLNRVYAQHKHSPEVAAVFGGSNARLIVAYSKNRSLGAELIRAQM